MRRRVTDLMKSKLEEQEKKATTPYEEVWSVRDASGCSITSEGGSAEVRSHFVYSLLGYHLMMFLLASTSHAKCDSCSGNCGIQRVKRRPLTQWWGPTL